MKRKYGLYESGEFVCQVTDGSVTKEYSTWHQMLVRCFDEKFKEKWPTYEECTCSAEFYSFQTFAKWMTEQVGFFTDCHLDKDLLLEGNKMYAPDKCLLLPHAVNTPLIHKRLQDRGLPTGVCYDSKRGKYIAQVNREGRYDMLGRFTTVEGAAATYKTAKEAEIKRVAEEYRDVLDIRAYKALVKFQVK